MRVDVFLKRVARRNALATRRPAQGRTQRHHGVEHHEHQQRPCQRLAQLIGDFQNPLCHARIDIFNPENAQNTPENGIQQADSPVQVERHIAVIPRGRAEERLLKPRTGVFHDRADQKTADKRKDAPAVAEAIQRTGQAERTDAVNQIERTVDQADAALIMPALNQAIERFQHDARKAADKEHPKQLIKRDALREMRFLLFPIVDLRVGRRGRQDTELLFLLFVVLLGFLEPCFHLVDQFVGLLQLSGDDVAVLRHLGKLFANLRVKGFLLRVVHRFVRGKQIHLPAQLFVGFVFKLTEFVSQAFDFFFRHR